MIMHDRLHCSIQALLQSFFKLSGLQSSKLTGCTFAVPWLCHNAFIKLDEQSAKLRDSIMQVLGPALSCDTSAVRPHFRDQICLLRRQLMGA